MTALIASAELFLNKFIIFFKKTVDICFTPTYNNNCKINVQNIQKSYDGDKGASARL